MYFLFAKKWQSSNLQLVLFQWFSKAFTHTFFSIGENKRISDFISIFVFLFHYWYCYGQNGLFRSKYLIAFVIGVYAIHLFCML